MNDKKQKFCGVIPAFYACYEDDGTVSRARTKAYARYLVDKGAKGLYVGGSSGECIYLEKEERMAGLEAVMEEVGGACAVIAHVACNNTRESMQLAAHAERLGADAIAAIPPIYFHLPEHAIAKYWNDISSAAPNTPFFIYNIPQLAGTALTPSLLQEMLKNPLVAGVKNSSPSCQDIQVFKALIGEDRVIFSGVDEQFVSGFAIGADGGIGGTYGAMIELFLRMETLMREGRLREAREIQYEVDEIIYALCAMRGNMYAAIKETLRLREGLRLGSVRAPLSELTREDMPKVEAVANRITRAIEKYQGSVSRVPFRETHKT